MDSQSGREVVSGLVALTDTSGEVMDAMVTDDSGRFWLSTPAPGDYLVVARATGYAPAWDGILEMGEGGYVEVTFYVRPAPFELPGITASVKRTERHLTMQGFYDRQEAGFGYFIEPEELEERMPRDTRDLLRSIPGLDFLNYGYAGDSVLCKHSRDPAEPTIYVDGVRQYFPEIEHTPGPDVDIDAVVGIDNIAAVEIYPRPSQVPLQYGGLDQRNRRQTCVILIWTKH